MSMRSTVRPDPSKGGRTRQSEKDSCDVNLIIANHRRGGVSAHVTQKVASYGFAPATTFQECLNEVRKAEETFAGLPAATRKFFANDPGRFVEYAADPKNVEKLVELGLAIPKEKPVPVLGSAENPIVTRSVDPPIG